MAEKESKIYSKKRSHKDMSNNEEVEAKDVVKTASGVFINLVLIIFYPS